MTLIEISHDLTDEELKATEGNLIKNQFFTVDRAISEDGVSYKVICFEVQSLFQREDKMYAQGGIFLFNYGSFIKDYNALMNEEAK